MDRYKNYIIWFKSHESYFLKPTLESLQYVFFKNEGKFQSRSFIEYLKVKSLSHKFQSEYGLRVQNTTGYFQQGGKIKNITHIGELIDDMEVCFSYTNIFSWNYSCNPDEIWVKSR